MIHQTYHEPHTRGKCFLHAPYVPFDLTSVGLDPAEQTQLSEYTAMRHLYQHPELDNDDWIGFTSVNQDKYTSWKFETPAQVDEQFAGGAQVVVWGWMKFQDEFGVPLSMYTAADRVHPGINRVIYHLLRMGGYSGIPAFYASLDGGPYHNYFAMGRPLFDQYMAWLDPLVSHCLAQWREAKSGPPANTFGYYFDSWPRATAYIHERLLICWLGFQHNIAIARCGSPDIQNADVARKIERQRMGERGKLWRDYP